MRTYTFKTEWRGAGEWISGEASATGDTTVEQDISVAGESTDAEVDTGLDGITELTGLYIRSDVAVTIEFASGSAPTTTITLAAGEAYHWNGLAADAPADWDEHWFITVAGAAAATIQVRAIGNAEAS